MAPLPGLRKGAVDLLGLVLSPAQIEAFEWYRSTLLEWNQRVNLTAITDPEAIEHKHFLDSLSCLLAMDPVAGDRLIDVGSGAGFPGLPLKIVRPQLGLTLVEANRKKVEFCQHVIEALGLEETEVVHARAEEVGQDVRYRQGFRWAVARAVAALPVLVEYLLPLLSMHGRAVVQKGESAHSEAQRAESALRLLGGKVARIIPVELPKVAEPRYLVAIDKIAATPDEFPRRPGMPAKRPL